MPAMVGPKIAGERHEPHQSACFVLCVLQLFCSVLGCSAWNQGTKIGDRRWLVPCAAPVPAAQRTPPTPRAVRDGLCTATPHVFAAVPSRCRSTILFSYQLGLGFLALFPSPTTWARKRAGPDQFVRRGRPASQAQGATASFSNCNNLKKCYWGWHYRGDAPDRRHRDAFKKAGGETSSLLRHLDSLLYA